MLKLKTAATSCLINLNQKVKKRDRLFHDEFEYSIEFPLIGAVCLRGLTTDRYIRNNVSTQFHNRRRLFNDAIDERKPQRMSTYNLQRQYNNLENLDILLIVADRLQEESKIRLRIRGHIMTVYAHDLCLLEDVLHWVNLIDDKEYVDKSVTVSVVELDRPRGTIRRKQSDYGYRFAFRHVQCPQAAYNNLSNFVATYKDHINPSAGLVNFLQKGWWSHATTESHFFIDANDPKLESIIRLAAPQILDTTYEIIVDK